MNKCEWKQHTWATTFPQTLYAMSIINLPFFRIGQNFICKTDLLELYKNQSEAILQKQHKYYKQRTQCCLTLRLLATDSAYYIQTSQNYTKCDFSLAAHSSAYTPARLSAISHTP